MSYNKILLINPPYSRSRVRVVFSAGLGYIAESMGDSGVEYDVLDMSLGYTYKHLARKIDDFGPDLIGLSMMTYGYRESYRLIERIKKHYPKMDIVVGGPHISLLREKVLTDCPSIDFGVVLEGEQILIELCRGGRPDSIKGLIFRENESVVYNGDRPFIRDLDNVSFPRYERFELDRSIQKDLNALPIVSSRGCPFDCVYCPVKCSIGGLFRARSPQSIVEELTYWYEKGYRRFSFADDNFTLLKERVYSLCELLEAGKLSQIGLSCDNGIRADCVDRDLLKYMKEVGFYRIAIGAEAGNDKVLRNLGKKEDIATIKKTIKDACDLGYEVDLFFLAGSPGETFEDLQDSFKITEDYPIGTAHFYNPIPFPNTPLFDWINENGRFLTEPEEYLNNYPILDNKPVFETSEMPYKERKKALSQAFGVTRKTMRRNWARRLVKLGLLGKAIAFVYSSKFTQDVILRNKFCRILVYKLARKIVSY